MNVQQKIANVLIVQRTIVQRSIHERERLVLGGYEASVSVFNALYGSTTGSASD